MHGVGSMDWRKLFLSFEGRINRAKYWLVMLVVVVALAPLGGAFLHRSELLYALAFIGVVVAVFLGFSSAIKRLHDRGKSGGWIVIFYLLPSILERIGDAIPDRMPYVAVSLLLYLCSFAIWVWAVVELGCLRGTTGTNQYGPDPLEGRV
jgi:uncharacterized membrane protein YhaH (DUF805 family)